jgi:hypothetical protein
MVLGAPEAMIDRGGFAFSALAEGVDSGAPWSALAAKAGEAIPAFADSASAQWILHKGIGDNLTVTDSQGRPVRLRLVGLFSRSVFASALIVSEQSFLAHFGAESGYRYLLIDAPRSRADEIKRLFRDVLGGLGARVEATAEKLAGFARVQNTYLSTFQTLGGIGLLIGAVGAVVALLRNVWERRAELALMLALGFKRRLVAALVLSANGLWLVYGVLLGAVSALTATAPHLTASQADVAWGPLLGILAAILVAGVGACGIAAFLSVGGSLLSALRSE